MATRAGIASGNLNFCICRRSGRRGGRSRAALYSPAHRDLLTPGARVSSLGGNRIALRGGVPVAVREGRVTRMLEELPPAVQREVEGALIRARVGKSGAAAPVPAAAALASPTKLHRTGPSRAAHR